MVSSTLLRSLISTELLASSGTWAEKYLTRHFLKSFPNSLNCISSPSSISGIVGRSLVPGLCLDCCVDFTALHAPHISLWKSGLCLFSDKKGSLTSVFVSCCQRARTVRTGDWIQGICCICRHGGVFQMDPVPQRWACRSQDAHVNLRDEL